MGTDSIKEKTKAEHDAFLRELANRDFSNVPFFVEKAARAREDLKNTDASLILEMLAKKHK